MTTDAVLVRPSLQHIPPAAVALAILLHALVGSALWWISPLKAHEPEEEPVMVTFDSSPSNRGQQAPERPGPPAPSIAASEQPSTESPRPEQQEALAPPSSVAPAHPPEPPPSLPIFEFSVPPVTEPPPPPTSRDFVKPPQPVRPVQRAQPQPRRPPAQQRPPADLPAIMPSPVPGPDPGDVQIGQGRQRNDYLSRVFRHLAPYRFNPTAARDTRPGGRVVTRVTLARDGRLIDVRLDTSSGRPALDAAEIAAIRKASPFPPVPANMPGDPVILVLPITY